MSGYKGHQCHTDKRPEAPLCSCSHAGTDAARVLPSGEDDGIAGCSQRGGGGQEPESVDEELQCSAPNTAASKTNNNTCVCVFGHTGVCTQDVHNGHSQTAAGWLVPLHQIQMAQVCEVGTQCVCVSVFVKESKSLCSCSHNFSRSIFFFKKWFKYKEICLRIIMSPNTSHDFQEFPPCSFPSQPHVNFYRNVA